MNEAAVGEWVPLADWQRLPAAPGVYCIRHLVSKKEYIGQSKCVRERIASHRAAVSSHYFGRALRRHGLTMFQVCVLELAETGLGLIEQEYIAARGSMAPDGYNLAAGGDGPTGVKWSDERKAAQSAARTGIRQTDEAKAKQRAARLANNPFKGQKHTPETLAKISAATIKQHTGMKRSAETRANISASLMGRAYSPMSEEGRERHRAAVSKPNPKKGARGERNFFFGKVGALAGKTGGKHPTSKAVGIWVPGSFTPICVDSVTEAATWAGMSVRHVCDLCSGKRKARSGVLFAYL